jgi:hypothetical protein
MSTRLAACRALEAEMYVGKAEAESAKRLSHVLAGIWPPFTFSTWAFLQRFVDRRLLLLFVRLQNFEV